MFKTLFLLLLSGCTITHETRTIIAIIDTGIDIKYLNEPYLCKLQHKDFTGTGILDIEGHGTNIVGIVKQYVDSEKECLLIIKYYDREVSGDDNLSSEIKAFNYAVKQGALFINLSGGGGAHSYGEFIAVEKALNNGATVVVAAGNERSDLSKNCEFFPACYAFHTPKFHVVGSLSGDYSNYGSPITDWEDGTSVEGLGIVLSGTSQATAKVTGKLIQGGRI